MAYAISNGAVLQATIRGKLHGQTVMNVFHWRWDQGATPITDGQAFLNQIHAALDVAGGHWSLYAEIVPTTWTLGVVDYQWIVPTRFRKVSAIPGQANGLNTASTTANLAVVTEFNGDKAGKRFQCVKHYPGVGGTNIVNGLLNPNVVGAMQDFGLKYLDPVVSGDGLLMPIVYGRPRAGFTDSDGVVHPPLPELKTVLTGLDPKNTVRVVRRRTVGVGI